MVTLGVVSAGCLMGAFASADTPPRESEARQHGRGAADRIQVADAQSLIGTDVTSHDGTDLGEVKYLLIRTSDGRIQYVVMDANGSLEANENDEGDTNDQSDQNDQKGQKEQADTVGNANLVAIPWRAIDTDVLDEQIELTVSREQASRAPRVTNEQLSEILNPTLVTRIDEFWASLPRRKSEPGTTGSANDESNQRPHHERGDQTARSDNSQNIDVLVSRRAVSTIVPASLTKASTLRDSEVVSADGREVGEVSGVAIDVRAGRVAYLVVNRGAFLGLGGGVMPVPFEAVRFSGADQPLRLTVTSGRLGQAKTFPVGSIPHSIARADLAKLYDRFGVRPYWNTSGQEPHAAR
jgi:sporulation protein YlmC with PRC-barrel domain